MFCLLAAAVLRLDNRPSLTANLGSVVTAMAIKLQDFWCHRLNKMQAGCVLVSQTEQNASRIVLGVTGETKLQAGGLIKLTSGIHLKATINSHQAW